MVDFFSALCFKPSTNTLIGFNIPFLPLSALDHTQPVIREVDENEREKRMLFGRFTEIGYGLIASN